MGRQIEPDVYLRAREFVVQRRLFRERFENAAAIYERLAGEFFFVKSK